MQTITLIAAVADNGCIGSGNAMPWHIAEDFAFFKRYTLGKPVVMGRKTWDSLPKKPLPGRRNIVITRQGAWQAEGAERAESLAGALALLADAPEIIIMGGAQIYTQALPLATDLRLTEVRLTINGDAFFPDFSPVEWQEAERSSHTAAANGIRFDFAHYRRVPQAT
ncbi:dihydrofolate reductase [Eikenella sp. S3360]|uniref:Dihydrofolate reductase n=1 Tax=Eikenella glucosivorans TaxID=2766967 RepID=A0ABS0NCX8_9NEIS|nr:dihydrofolate reductase [Eikenella glucosivorans]MBH5330131.1 dihydrofolate reductase [Eikenella glucosivorans]